MSSTSPEVMKWFTRARRFPQLIGRTPDGARIPGGPYTVTQVIGAGAVLFLGTRTFGLWAHYGLLTNATILLSVAFAVVFGLGKIPVGSRNPLSVISGALRALSAPPTGRLGGRPVRIRRPHQVRHRLAVLPTPGPPVAAVVQLDVPDISPQQPKPAAARAATPVTRVHRRLRRLPQPHRAAAGPPAPTAPPRQQPAAPRPRSAPALSGVQALLARGSAVPPAHSSSSPTHPAERPRPKDR